MNKEHLAVSRINPPATFLARLASCPLPFDRATQAEIAASASDLAPEFREFIAAVAACSPYLRDLIKRESDLIRALPQKAPETVFAEVIAALTPNVLPEIARALRRAKARVALLVALADFGGVWTLAQVTEALTRFADRAVALTLEAALSEEIRRGRIPGASFDDLATGAGMVVFAMGKMGAYELNYSSDIDLICLFDESRFAPADRADARAAFVRATRKMTALLSDLTPEGYVFRVDLRLRPDAAVTPVCLSMEAAERYYESLGRTWERAAWIKARPCAGDLAAGLRFQELLRPFVWRRYLDFVAVQETHEMILRIRTHKGLALGTKGLPSLDGFNLKLGPGGIREIEFFVQTRQLIAGGRDPALRAPDTLGALSALTAKGWVPKEVAELLSAAYSAHRTFEHRLQMVHDAQTHTLPSTVEGWQRLAYMLGEADPAQLRAALAERLAAVAALTEGFFAPPEAPPMPPLSDKQADVVASWRAYPALRSERAQAIFARITPQILDALARAAQGAGPGAEDEALAAFDRFLAGLPAGVQLFSLFEANPILMELIADICAVAPRLGEYLSRHSGVFDAVIAGDFFAPWPGAAALAKELAQRLAEQPDYERVLRAARSWMQERHFRIGVHHLRGLIDAAEAAVHYADLAEAVLAALWPQVQAEFARRHGPPPGRGAAIVGMGSLGARRLNAASDLDLIVIYDPAGQEASSGPRPLPARSYYARLTQALITALISPLPEGRLYQVDMRLRPSGRQGPVATVLDAFRLYQRNEAWTWEHLALTRARAVAGPAELCEEIESFRRALLAEKAHEPRILADVADMRARLRAARPGGGALEAKDGPGRLQDIDLFAQAGALRAGSAARSTETQLAAARRAGLILAEEETTLAHAARLMWRVQAVMRLLGDRTTDPEKLGAGARRLLLRETGAPDLPALVARLEETARAAAAVIDRYAPCQDPNDDGHERV